MTLRQEGQGTTTVEGLAERVRARREELNLRREDIAAKAGVSMSTVTRLERVGTTSLANLKAIADALETTVAALLGEGEAA